MSAERWRLIREVFHATLERDAAVVVRMKDEAEIPPSIAGGMIRAP